ncbi:hypothetical protein MHYP_G00120750 [Metynnis hypsauchen]
MWTLGPTPTQQEVFFIMHRWQLKPPAAVTRVAHFLRRRDMFAHFPAQNICNQATTRPIPPQTHVGCV